MWANVQLLLAFILFEELSIWPGPGIVKYDSVSSMLLSADLFGSLMIDQATAVSAITGPKLLLLTILSWYWYCYTIFHVECVIIEKMKWVCIVIWQEHSFTSITLKIAQKQQIKTVAKNSHELRIVYSYMNFIDCT